MRIHLCELLMAIALCSAPAVAATNSPIHDYKQLGLSKDQADRLGIIEQRLKQLTVGHEREIDTLANKMTDGLMAPLPNQSQVLSTEKEILKLRSEINIARLQATISARKLLNPEQQQNLVYSNPNNTFKGVNLTNEQRQRYWALRKEYLVASISNSVAQQKTILDLAILLKRPMPDGDALLAKQMELNQLKNEIALKAITLEVNLRKLLTADQREVAYSRHHPQIWRDTGINDQQDQQLEHIHCKIEQADEHGRAAVIPLSADILRLASEPMPNENALLDKQRQYDQVLGETELAQLQLILDARTVLNPTQRQKLYEFMRAHPIADH